MILNYLLGSMVNMLGGYLYDHLMSMRMFTLMVNNMLIRALKIMSEFGYERNLDLLIILH